MNTCTFEGNVGKDPDIKFTPGGSAVAKFSIAVSKPDYKNKDNWITTWINFKALGKKAESCRNIRSGDRVVIANAEYCCDRWDDRDGNKREFHYFLIGFGATIGVSKFKDDENNNEGY